MNGLCTVSRKGTLFEWQNCMLPPLKKSYYFSPFFVLRKLGIYKIRKDLLASLFVPFGFIDAYNTSLKWVLMPTDICKYFVTLLTTTDAYKLCSVY